MRLSKSLQAKWFNLGWSVYDRADHPDTFLIKHNAKGKKESLTFQCVEGKVILDTINVTFESEQELDLIEETIKELKRNCLT